MSQGWFRAFVVLLLLAVVSLQVLVLRKIPEITPSPTTAQLKAASPEKRRELLSQIPLVTINGTVRVAVDGTVDVEVENILPIPVTIER